VTAGGVGFGESDKGGGNGLDKDLCVGRLGGGGLIGMMVRCVVGVVLGGWDFDEGRIGRKILFRLVGVRVSFRGGLSISTPYNYLGP